MPHGDHRKGGSGANCLPATAASGRKPLPAGPCSETACSTPKVFNRCTGRPENRTATFTSTSGGKCPSPNTTPTTRIKRSWQLCSAGPNRSQRTSPEGFNRPGKSKRQQPSGDSLRRLELGSLRPHQPAMAWPVRAGQQQPTQRPRRATVGLVGAAHQRSALLRVFHTRRPLTAPKSSTGPGGCTAFG